MWTEALQQAATREQTVKYGSRWIGHMVTDCSGLIRWALKQLGEDIVHHATYQYTDWCSKKGKLVNGQREDGKPILPGTEVFLQGGEDKIHHCGVYVGNGICIEAKGTQYGVVTSKLDHWDHWGELKMVDYSGETPVTPDKPDDVLFRAVVDNPNTWLNVRSGPGMQYPLRFQVHKDSTVDVLATEPEWWQIRYGGQIGWAFAQYLKPVDGQEPEQPETEQPEEPETTDDILGELCEIREKLNAIIAKVRGLGGVPL